MYPVGSLQDVFGSVSDVISGTAYLNVTLLVSRNWVLTGVIVRNQVQDRRMALMFIFIDCVGQRPLQYVYTNRALQN